MIAGQLALLNDPADEQLANYHDQTGRALEVEETQTYLNDDLTIQSGMIAGEVPKQDERVILDGHEITVEKRDVKRRVPSKWIADVDGKGWILAERTHSSDLEHEPDWPFNDFATRTGREISPVRFKPWEFVRHQRDEGRSWTVEMASREQNLDDVSINWGTAQKHDAINADVGVALTTHWRDMFVEVCLYGSGYLAIWDPPEMKPELLGRFIDEEIIPISYFGDEAEIDEVQQPEQAPLEDETEVDA